MPAKKEKARDYIGYRVPPDIEKKIDNLIQSKEFDTKADVLSVALRFWFENKDNRSSKDEIKAWIVSEEGTEYLKNMIRRVKDE